MLTGEIFDVKRFAVHDGDGIRTTVFFKGCPLRCKWCHNPEGLSTTPVLYYNAERCIGCGVCSAVCQSGAHKMESGKHSYERDLCTLCGTCEIVCPQKALKLYGKTTTIDALLPILTEDREFFLVSGGGITLSGGEPLLQSNFCAALLEKLKYENIHTAVDTCGAVDFTAVEHVMPYTDVFLYDVKAIDESVHIACTGASNRQILDNLQHLGKLNMPVEIRIPLVPGMNDDELPAIAAFLSTVSSVVKVRILSYHPYAAGKYRGMGIDYPAAKVNSPNFYAIQKAGNILSSVLSIPVITE